MAYLSLYRQYRSQTFADIVEQSAVVKILQNTIKFERLNHAYIFSGPRGTGKTSLARIFAKTLNCLNLSKDNPEPCNTCSNCLAITKGEHMDVFEVDAASNTSVDNVREIIDKVNFLPALSPYKIYIIDEAHMLSTSAFNALLKTLEEPPKHVVFILATTDPQKIPVTIQSRCQRLDFVKISQSAIVNHLQRIVNDQKVDVSQEALMMISKYSGGHMRDALSILDQVLAFSEGKIQLENVLEVVGTANLESIVNIIKLIIRQDLSVYFQSIEDMYYKGLDSIRFVTDVIELFRDILLIQLKLEHLLMVPANVLKELKEISVEYKSTQLSQIIKQLSFAIPDIRYMEDSRIYVETLLCEVLLPDSLTPVASMSKPEVISNKVVAPPPQVEKKEPLKEVIKESVKETAPPVEAKKPPPIEEVVVVAHPDDDVDLVSIKHQWTNIIATLKKKKMMRLAAYLMEGVPISFKDKQVLIGYKKEYKFHCDSLNEEKNALEINLVTSELLKEKVAIKCIIMDSKDIPADLANDLFTESRLIEDKDIPANVKDMASFFEGEVVRD